LLQKRPRGIGADPRHRPQARSGDRLALRHELRERRAQPFLYVLADEQSNRWTLQAAELVCETRVRPALTLETRYKILSPSISLGFTS